MSAEETPVESYVVIEPLPGSARKSKRLGEKQAKADESVEVKKTPQKRTRTARGKRTTKKAQKEGSEDKQEEKKEKKEKKQKKQKTEKTQPTKKAKRSDLILPADWRIEERPRASGVLSSRVDYYYHSPDGKVFRSIAELKRAGILDADGNAIE